MAVNNNFAYIEKTLPGVVDKVFALASLTEALIGGSEIKLDFLDAKTVKIFMLASSSLTDYKRGGHGEANHRGAAQSTTETFTLSQERYSEIPLDKLDTLDDGETVLGHLATEFIRTKVVPEFDTYRFSKLASYCSASMGNMVVETIAANTIISKFNAAFKWMAEQKVPESDQIIYVNPDVMEQIRNTTELAKRLHQSDMSKNVQFAIEEYENRPIVVVPSDMFYTLAQTGDGIYPSSSSKVINFMVVSKKAPIIVKKLDYAKVFNSTGPDGSYLGYVGYLFTNLYYHDIFVPHNKRVALYCSVSEVSAISKSRALLVDVEAGIASGKTKFLGALTQPAGLMYDKVELLANSVTSAPAIGASVSGTELVVGEEFTPNDDHNFIVATLDGKVVAVSKDFTTNLPVGA
jgi:hypothetical protein